MTVLYFSIHLSTSNKYDLAFKFTCLSILDNSWQLHNEDASTDCSVWSSASVRGEEAAYTYGGRFV